LSDRLNEMREQLDGLRDGLREERRGPKHDDDDE